MTEQQRFLRTLKAATKIKTYKLLDFIKISHLLSKDTTKKASRQATNCEKIFGKHISVKRLTS